MNQITVNVNKPEEIIVPDDDIDVPNTGIFSVENQNNNTVVSSTNINGVAIALLIIVPVLIAVAALRYKMKKEETNPKSNKRMISVVSSIILILTTIAVFGYLKSNDQHYSARAEGETSDTLSITTNDVAINIELENDPVYAMSTSTVTVNSATEAGYVLSAYVENANLVSEESTDQITSLTTSEATKLSDNTWGVALASPTDQNSEVFFGLPTDASTPMVLKQTDEATAAGDAMTLYYATYVTPELDYGTYTGAVINYIAVANPTSLYMQDIANWKDDLEEDTPVEAKDRRDGKTYLVSKTKDGKIWMMQNLDLDLNANTTYTNEDTDLGYNTTTGEYETASWQPSSGTATDAEGWTVSNFAPASYDPGDWYWNGNESDWYDWDDYYDTCTLNPETSKLNCDDSVDPFPTYVGSTGIPQYHLGNYYNWSAAVATNDGSVYTTSGEIANDSICPTGWRLPGVDEFFDLWAEYGFTSSAISGENKLWTEPLYFVISGGFNTVMDYVGSDGSFWSSEVRDETQSWGVDYAVDGWFSDVYGRRNYGHSVRCVAR